MSSLVTLVGNPRAASRTHRAATAAAGAIADRIGWDGPREVIDLSALAAQLYASDPTADLDAALKTVADAHVLVVASPTYKGTYTGLLKSFLDLLPSGALAGTTALPLLVMGAPQHALAVEVHLRPLLVELGAHVPTPGLALLESQLPELEKVLGEWAERTAPQIPREAAS
ncbi:MULTISPECIES: NADPH-dependent FMN reductase [Thermomonospora]|uniref:NADPH-dependent FMN reductase n=1 Tax=Thermomonospora curvata (strain ATCC 19995 / DSM 43183 / JCM 3096 / KCTC 9072 / NBRC 15933 / NCIMB 10081 / Henssen B9) TaxID=471852 RepID=D1A3E3_THECD|nr:MULTISPECIES: NAD(P)H-dependent oxidoreductase [Thermomonospora]ACY96068.1 NADPH-dependent FMN reductase [Thermomonospora curvata DSM 43183]PKK15931.1 MAG: FMN reductase [Thermomonospora sp. CIF 1]